MPKRVIGQGAKKLLPEQWEAGLHLMTDPVRCKSYLDACARQYPNGYSFPNSILVWMQNPLATDTLGAETWKEYGRAVKPGATGIQILLPVMAEEKAEGGLFQAVKSGLLGQLSHDPSVETASYAIGSSGIAFTMHSRNRLIGLCLQGRNQGLFKGEEAVKEFIGRAILNKLPIGYKSCTVFDREDVFVPDHLWVRAACSEEELVLDERSHPIKNSRGQYQIENTPQRQGRPLACLIPRAGAATAETMPRLMEACMAVCDGLGIPFCLGGHQMGSASRCRALLTQMGYALLNAEPALAGAALTEPWRDLQAQSIAYVAAKAFGLEGDVAPHPGFADLAENGGLQVLRKALECIHRQSQGLIAGILESLYRMGVQADLSRQDATPLEPAHICGQAQAYLDFCTGQDAICRADEAVLPRLARQYRGCPGMEGVLSAQQKNLDRRKEDLALLGAFARRLVRANSRYEQEKILTRLDAAKRRMMQNNAALDRLKENGNQRLKEQLIGGTQPEEALFAAYGSVREPPGNGGRNDAVQYG